MPLEIWSTIAAVGTFVVITATAIAAVLQLRHLSSANKVAAIQTFFTAYEGAELREAFRVVRAELKQRLQDPAYRHELRTTMPNRANHPEIAICNFFDQWGLYYRDGAIDRTSFMRAAAGVVASFWTRLEPVVALIQDPEKGNLAFEQFEYLAVQARHWMAKHPNGDYPKSLARMAISDPWREIDRPTAGDIVTQPPAGLHVV